jgi:AAA domain
VTTKPRTKAPIVPTGTVLAEPPAPVPLIEDTVPGNAVVLLVGTPGSGRSTTLAEWAAAVALGTDWNGHPVERRRVLYLDASREQRDIADTAEAIAGGEVPGDWLRVLASRIDLRDDFGRWLDVIRAGGYGLILLDALGDLGSIAGLDDPRWAVEVSALAARLFDVTTDGGSVVLTGTCDARGAIAGAPLGDGVDAVLRLDRIGGRGTVRAMGPARSGRRRTPAPTPPTAEQVFELSGERGGWDPEGRWMPTDLTPLDSGRYFNGLYAPKAPRV